MVSLKCGCQVSGISDQSRLQVCLYVSGMYMCPRYVSCVTIIIIISSSSSNNINIHIHTCIRIYIYIYIHTYVKISLYIYIYIYLFYSFIYLYTQLLAVLEVRPGVLPDVALPVHVEVLAIVQYTIMYYNMI